MFDPQGPTPKTWQHELVTIALGRWRQEEFWALGPNRQAKSVSSRLKERDPTSKAFKVDQWLAHALTEMWAVIFI